MGPTPHAGAGTFATELTPPHAAPRPTPPHRTHTENGPMAHRTHATPRRVPQVRPHSSLSLHPHSTFPPSQVLSEPIRCPFLHPLSTLLTPPSIHTPHSTLTPHSSLHTPPSLHTLHSTLTPYSLYIRSSPSRSSARFLSPHSSLHHHSTLLTPPFLHPRSFPSQLSARSSTLTHHSSLPHRCALAPRGCGMEARPSASDFAGASERRVVIRGSEEPARKRPRL